MSNLTRTTFSLYTSTIHMLHKMSGYLTSTFLHTITHMGDFLKWKPCDSQFFSMTWEPRDFPTNRIARFATPFSRGTVKVYSSLNGFQNPGDVSIFSVIYLYTGKSCYCNVCEIWMKIKEKYILILLSYLEKKSK